MEDALHAGRLTYEDSALFWRRYEDALASYTYLRPSAPARVRDTLVPATPPPQSGPQDGPLPPPPERANDPHDDDQARIPG